MEVVELLRQNENKDLLRFITAGSVDDGKSTLIGRLLYEANGIYEDQLAGVRKASGKRGSMQDGLDLSLVTDGLKAEREQGITIDVAYRYFSTPMRKFIIADTPGHEQYTRNMATGASTAGMMIILIDARNGVLPQSRRHAFIASLLGIQHVLVAVNKMDLVEYSREIFEKIRADFEDFASKLLVRDMVFIPVSALAGDNIVTHSSNMPWYEGTTLLNHLQTVHIASDRNLIDLRLPVQFVNRFEDESRGYMGTVVSGVIRPGEEVLILPGGNRAIVKKVIGPDGEMGEAFASCACTVTLDRQVDVSRGNLIVHPHNVPRITNNFDATLVWMSETPMETGKPYYIKHLTRTVPAEVSQIRFQIDVNTLHRRQASQLALNEIGRVEINTGQPLTFDPYTKNRGTGAFILIDQTSNNTVAAGMILDREPSELVPSDVNWSAQPRSRNVEHHESLVSAAERSAKLGHKPACVWLTGLTGAGKTTIAYNLERRLHGMGCSAFVINGENLRLGLSKDLGFSADDRGENIRRASEVARMINDAGLIAICDFLSPYRNQRELARQAVGAEKFFEVHIHADAQTRQNRDAKGLYKQADAGKINLFPGVSAPYEEPNKPSLKLDTDKKNIDQCVAEIVNLLKQNGIVS